jgi:hypothetical protein
VNGRITVAVKTGLPYVASLQSAASKKGGEPMGGISGGGKREKY